MISSNKNNIEHSFKDLFWEIIPDSSFDIIDHGNVNPAFKRIILSRGANFELKCRLEADIGDDIKARMALTPYKVEPIKQGGVFAFGDSLVAKNQNLKIEIKNFHFSRMDANQDPCFIEGNAYEARILSNKSLEEPEYISYWYLNGLPSSFMYCRSSEREFKTTLKLKIDSIEKEIERSISKEISIDCMRLSINNKTFILGKVNESFLEGIPCNYLRFSKENLPSKEELEAIENCLSFIFGRIFMFIGYSKYSLDFKLIERLFQNSYTYGTDLDTLTKLPSYEPIIIHRVRLGDVETVINQNLANYIELLKAFPLNEVVEAINMFRIFPYDLKIMPLSAALDMIKIAFFKSDKSTSKGKHLDDSNYKAIIEKYLESIRTDLKAANIATTNDVTTPQPVGVDKTTPIINRIKIANNFSNNEQIQAFFKELDLEISEIELRALKTRNIVVHGSTKGKNDQEFIDNVHIYYTLLNKVLLKLLSYKGSYIDFGTHGFPARLM